MARRTVIVSSGSMDVAVRGRNAENRLAIGASLGGYFDRVDYVFFRTAKAARYEISPGLTVHDVSGVDDGSTPGNVWLRRARLLARGLAKIEAIARDNQPDVVGVLDPFVSGLLGWQLARRLRIPLTLFLVADYEQSFKAGLLKGIPSLPPAASFGVESLVLRASDLVFTDTRHYGAYAARRGARPDRVCVIPRFADATFYATDAGDAGIWERLGVPDPAPVVYVGRLSPEKYPLDLIEAFARATAMRPERHLVIIGGGGPQEADTLARAAALGCGARVHVRRGLGRPELRAAMKEAGALVAPHGGYALLEAMLSGAAVVAYDYEWHPEVITPEETGLLAPYRDVATLAKQIERLLADPAFARSLARAGRARCLAEYSEARTVSAQRAALDALFARWPNIRPR